MADVNRKIFLLRGFCVICTIFMVNGTVVMQQEDGCGSLEGTWAFKRTETANVTTYFNVKKKEEKFRFTTTTVPEDLPFSYEKVDLNHEYLLAIDVDLEDVVTKVLKQTVQKDKGCNISFVGGSILEKVKNISHVHLIYMNHLDVGFNTNQNYPGTKKRMPGYILNVLNWYFQVYFPRAMKLGNELREIRASESFIYTTHPWLVNLYLDCPELTLSGVKLQCPTDEQVEDFRRAVWMGDINWHAGPLNQEVEASNPELFAYSLTLSQKLDDYFGIKRTARTLSQRDVPGMTRAAIPYMVENGIVAASFGVNGRSAPPDVPSPNVWKFNNYSIITYWHKGGYPLPPGPSPAQPGGLGRRECQMVDGSSHGLCFAFHVDNLGPPDNVQEIKHDFTILKFQFPAAEIKASTFEDFTKELLPLKDSLPVIDKEIGDTWIQGPASDPLKMSHYRTINRLRSQCLRTKECDLNDKRFDDMSRFLLKLPEHTYGLSIPSDEQHYSNQDFQPLQYMAEDLKNHTMSWLSHRAFNDIAIQALGKHPLASRIRTELKKLQPYLPDLSQHEWRETDEIISCRNGMKLRIGSQGALTQLTDLQGREWADDQNPLALIIYKTLNSTDFLLNSHYYDYRPGVGMFKPNMDYTKAESRFWEVEAHGIYISKTGDPCKEGIYVRVLHKDMKTWYTYGAPVSYFLKYQLVNNDLEIEYQFFNKPSTRLPEALFLSFNPRKTSDHHWYLHKLGYLIDPMNVVNNGSQYVHGIDEGFAYLDREKKGLLIDSLDVATVVIETEDHPLNPLPSPLRPLTSPPTAMAYNIYNNIWETNFIYWYPYQPQDKHYKARFRLRFQY